MALSLVVDESCLSDSANLVSEDCSVWRYKSLQVSRSWSRSSASWIKLLRDNLVDESRIASQFGAHFIIRILPGRLGVGAPFDDELEALIELIFNLFSIFEVSFRVLL